MKEEAKSSVLSPDTATQKLILCEDRFDRGFWADELGRAVYRDESYEYDPSRDSSDSLLVRDNLLNIDFFVTFLNLNQWSWVNKARGKVYDEVLVTDRAFERGMYTEDIPSILSRVAPGRDPKSNALYYLLNNDDKVSKNLKHKVKLWTGKEPVAKGFDFPPTLFRRCMDQYFQDWRNPTVEEFIFALTMEGISGNTEREKKAIEEANLYIQNKGN